MDNKLRTIQKNINLEEAYKHGMNEIWRNDDPDSHGGCHHYTVYHDINPDTVDGTRTDIHFMHGAWGEEGSVGGVTDQDLLEIVRDRLAAFQQGDMPSRETACALTHVEEALMWLNKRAEDRAERGVLGTYNK